MRVFVTGASGWIGSAVVPDLLAAGHEVEGLARSAEAAAKLAAAGATVRPGSLDDVGALQAGAESCDAVIHLAFIHDFIRFDAAVQTDLAAIEALGDTLAGSGKALLIASGVVGLVAGRPATEADAPNPAFPRSRAAELTVALAERGVRSGVVRLPPTVHGRGDHGFVPTLITIARQRGVSGYVADGTNRWSAVHRQDAARLFALALERATPGAVLHAVAEEGIEARRIAETIGHQLGVPALSVAPEDADEHFGFIGRFFATDAAATSERTRETLGWEPTGPGLLADLEAGYSFDATDGA